MDYSHELLPNILNENRMLSSGIKTEWTPTSVGKSLANHLLNEIEMSVEEKGDWLFLEDLVRKQRLTAGDVLKMTRNCSAVFRSMGMKKGDVVHIFVGNHIYSHILIIGTWAVGGVASLGIGDGTLKAEIVADQLLQLDCKFIVCLPETYELMTKAVEKWNERLLAVENIIEANSEERKPIILVCGETNGALNLETMLSEEASEAVTEFEEIDEHSDTCAIFWSSGTTGQTKGICHTPYSVWNFGGFVMELQLRESTYFSSLSLFHCSGYWLGVVALLRRNTIFMIHHDNGQDIEMEDLSKKIVEVQPKFLALHAHYFTHMLSTGALHSYDDSSFDSIEIIRPAGSAVPKVIEDVYRRMFKNLKKIMNTYGSSETGIVSVSYDLQKAGCVLPFCSLKIRNFVNGAACGANEYGEVVLKTPYMMKNYHSLYNADNKDCFDEEGYFRTGDVGIYDDNGFWHYIDRCKDLIYYQGHAISPYEIEEVLHDHPSVLESLVYGVVVPGDYQNQLVAACVTLVEGVVKTTTSELLEFVNSQLPEHKWIRGPIVFVEKLPRNGMGKLMRGRRKKLWKVATIASLAVARFKKVAGRVSFSA